MSTPVAIAVQPKALPQIHFNLFGGFMVGGDNDDIFLGLGSNYIKGHGGDDVYILAGSALDTNTIYGDHGNNRVIDYGDSTNFIRLGTGHNQVDILGGGGGTIEVGYKAVEDFYYVQLEDGSLDQRWFTHADEGAGGDNIVNAGRGNTTIIDHAGNSLLNGNVGHDNIYGGGGDDTINGGGGNDFLYGDVGNDRLSGGEGDDTLVGGRGFDILEGGTGTNHYYFTVGDLLNLSEGANLLTFDGSDGRAGMTAIFGAGADDTLRVYDWQHVDVYQGAVHITDQYGTDEWLVGPNINMVGISIIDPMSEKG